MSMRGVAVVAALAAAGSVFADTHNVADGATDTLSGVTETSRFTKTGGGTLVLSGDNSLATVTVSAGTLNIHGGTTTFGDSSATAADATLDASKAKGTYYKIVDAPNGFTGTFDKSALPSSWDVKYSADGKSVYLRYLKGAKIVVR